MNQVPPPPPAPAEDADPIQEMVQDSAQVAPGAPWLNPVLILAWIGIYLLAMWLSEWQFKPQWPGGAEVHPVVNVFAYGMPEGQAQNRIGAPVPALVVDGEYHRVLLSSLINTSLIALFFSVWIWFSIGRQLRGTIGAARTWLVFSLGGVAIAALHAYTEPTARLSLAGSWGPWMAALGVMAVYGFLNKGQLAKVFRRRVIFTLIWIILLGVILSLVIGAPLSLEGVFAPIPMGGGLGMGILLGLLFGPRRMMQAAGSPTRISAIALGLATVAAFAFTVPDVFAGSAPDHVEDHMKMLGELDRHARDVYDDGMSATQENRFRIRTLREAVLSQPWLEDWEGTPALREYLDLYDRLIEANVPDPHGLRTVLRHRFKAYAEHEVRLRLLYAIQERPVNYWDRD